MTWKTHAAIGVNAVWLTAMLGSIDQSLLVLLPVAFVASLLPDIDYVGREGHGAKIHYMAGGIFGAFHGLFYGKYFHHRGLMHSVFIGAILAIFLFIPSRSVPLVPHVFFLAYISHPIIDGFNTGVGYLYPFSLRKFALLPRRLRTPVNGVADNLLFFAGVLGIVIFLYLASQVLVVQNRGLGF